MGLVTANSVRKPPILKRKESRLQLSTLRPGHPGLQTSPLAFRRHLSPRPSDVTCHPGLQTSLVTRAFRRHLSPRPSEVTCHPGLQTSLATPACLVDTPVSKAASLVDTFVGKTASLVDTLVGKTASLVDTLVGTLVGKTASLVDTPSTEVSSSVSHEQAPFAFHGNLTPSLVNLANLPITG